MQEKGDIENLINVTAFDKLRLTMTSSGWHLPLLKVNPLVILSVSKGDVEYLIKLTRLCLC
jgi:hypothetical protein